MQYSRQIHTEITDTVQIIQVHIISTACNKYICVYYADDRFRGTCFPIETLFGLDPAHFSTLN